MKNLIFFQVLLLSFSLLFITSCEEDDPCELITCLNDGVCVNGTCDCEDGFTGPDCSDQITPSSMRITNIRVTRFPATDANGSSWDLTNGADIFIEMAYNDEAIYTHPTTIDNVEGGQTYDFVPATNLHMNNVTDTYELSLLDDDGLEGDEFLGGISFTPYSSNNKFPTILSLDVANGAVAFELTVEYTF